MKTTKSVILLTVALLLAGGTMLSAQDAATNTAATTVVQVAPAVTTAPAAFKPWARVRGSYQFVLESDLSNKSAFEIDRARLGMDGMFLKDVYFKVDIDAKNTKKGKGAELKAAFISWNFSKYHWLDVGAITTTFARALSGTEYAFINYDITTGLDAYQYGVQLRGLLGNGFLSYFVSVNNGEGYSSINTGNGFCYMGRVELQLMGKNYKTAKDGTKVWQFADLREGAPKANDKTLTIGIAGALDQKFESPDYGQTFESFNGIHAIADLTFRMNGLSFFAQGNFNSYGQKYNDSYWGGANGNVKESMGGFAQLGFNLKNSIGAAIEPMVKFEYWKDTVNEGADDIIYEKTQFAVGINWYIKEHKAKVNFEYRRVLSDDYEGTYIIKPSEDYVGLRFTHSFSSPRIGG